MLWFLAIPLTLAADPVPVEVSVRGSIEASLVREVGGDGAALAAQVARLLRWRGDVVRNVQPKDSLRLLYTPDPEPLLVALDYAGSEISVRAYEFEDTDGVARFYDEKAQLVEPGMKNSPAPGYVQITETVQSGRGKRRHKGMDFKGPEGLAIVSPFAGTVSRVNWSTRSNGLCVEIAISEGRLIRFLHLSAVDSMMKPRAKVAAGDVVGALGSTGRSSAPHLHYEVRKRSGAVLDPLAVHGTEVIAVSAERRAAFDAQRRRYDALLGARRSDAASVR